MIHFDRLEQNQEELRLQYLTNRPFSYLVIDDFCDTEKLMELRSQIPDLKNKSRAMQGLRMTASSPLKTLKSWTSGWQKLSLLNRSKNRIDC